MSDEQIQTEGALRYNDGKPQYSLLDLQALEPCVRVLEFGALKYSRDNWKKGMPVTKIIDSLLRHLGALRSGELLDPESGLPHIGHIQCNALFLGNLKNTLDITICDLKLEEDQLQITTEEQLALINSNNTADAYRESLSELYLTARIEATKNKTVKRLFRGLKRVKEENTL